MISWQMFIFRYKTDDTTSICLIKIWKTVNKPHNTPKKIKFHSKNKSLQITDSDMES